MLQEGDSRVITPIGKSGLPAVLARTEPLNENLPEGEDLPLLHVAAR